MDFDANTWIFVGKFFGAGIALGLGGIGAAIGMGNAAAQANEAMMRQPRVQGDLLRTMLIGQAVGGSPSIFALVVGLMILFVDPAEPELMGANYFAAMVGAGLAIGLGAFGSGVGCGWPAGYACDGHARNPRHAGVITRSMIIGQAVAQSPSIFAMVIALFLILNAQPGSDWLRVGTAIAAGIAMGASALGSGIGSGQAAGGAAHGIGSWPASAGVTLRMMLVGQAICETPAIFGLLVAFIMLFALQGISSDLLGFAHLIGAAIATGFGGIGPGIGIGLAGRSGCEAVAAAPERQTLILRTTLIGAAVSESTAIYSLIIALLLLYVV